MKQAVIITFFSTLAAVCLSSISCTQVTEIKDNGNSAHTAKNNSEDSFATEVHEEYNSVYYWKTVLSLDDSDINFIRQHNIKRIYLRMFDVSRDQFATEPNGIAVPNATLKIADYVKLQKQLDSIEIVPVVYITIEALKAMKDFEDVLATNITTRVRNMCQYNDLTDIKELQLDCDWTASTEDQFFKLCELVKQNITRLNLRWRLSSTLRLHQISHNTPPVDNVVLMVYNTGNFKNPDDRNSIIKVNDVEPYLKNLQKYPLHMDIAYPTYSWQLLFRKRNFIGLLNGIETSDKTTFKRKDENNYIALRDIPYKDIVIHSGDVIRQESSDYKEILKVKLLIDGQLCKRAYSNILYHLDSGNFSKYSSDEINTLYSNCR